MVTFGAAPLIVSAFRRVRRSRSTDALQTSDPGRAGVHLLAEALHGAGPSNVLTRIKRERVPTFFRMLLGQESGASVPVSDEHFPSPFTRFPYYLTCPSFATRPSFATQEYSRFTFPFNALKFYRTQEQRR